jgi:hypothetical protein
MNVHLGNDSFLFEKLALTSPNCIVGGSYLTKFTYNGSKHPLYIQTPKTLSKHGIIVAGKKAYIDILLTSDHADFIEWVSILEKRSIDLLYEKRHLWFTEELDKCDIEDSFTSPIRSFKSGQNYLIRVNLDVNRLSTNSAQQFLCKVFDENRQVVPVEYIKPEQQIISIIEFQGIKFTRRSFQVELLLRQVLVVPDVQLPIFETCVISTSSQSDTKCSNIESCVNGSGDNKEINREHITNEINESGGIAIADETTNAEHLGEESIIATNGSTLIKHLMAMDVNEPTNINTIGYLKDIPNNAIDKSLKHFELAEIDIDFKNISDTIDIEQATFDIDNIDDNKTNNDNCASSSKSNKKVVMGSSISNSNLIPSGTNICKNKGNITLKKHKDVIYEMYKIAKRKAQEAKKAAIRAYLEAKEIKATYMLDDLEDSDIDSDSGSGSGPGSGR